MRDDLLTASRPELLDNGDDRMLRGMLHDYFAFARDLEAARSVFAGHIGLSPTQYMILIAIAHAPDDERLGISQVADRLHLSGAFVTIEVNGLESEGLVTKTPHPGDRRRVQLAVTGRGEERLGQLAVLQRPVNDALFGMLSREEVRQFASMLSRLQANSGRAVALARHLEATMEPAEHDIVRSNRDVKKRRRR